MSIPANSPDAFSADQEDVFEAENDARVQRQLEAPTKPVGSMSANALRISQNQGYSGSKHKPTVRIRKDSK